MLKLPTLPPPSYPGSLHSRDEDIELPEYSESPLYAAYQKDVKRPPSPSQGNNTQNSLVDLERQDEHPAPMVGDKAKRGKGICILPKALLCLLSAALLLVILLTLILDLCGVGWAEDVLEAF